MDKGEDHQVQAPLAVEEGEGEGWETTSLWEGGQVDDHPCFREAKHHQESWFESPSPVGDLRVALALVLCQS